MNHLKLFWIPSHIGIVDNEEADRLAKLATESTNADICLSKPISYGI